MSYVRYSATKQYVVADDILLIVYILCMLVHTFLPDVGFVGVDFVNFLLGLRFLQHCAR